MGKKFTQSLLRMPTAQSLLQLKFSSRVNPIIPLVMPCVCGQKIHSVSVLRQRQRVLVMNPYEYNACKQSTVGAKK